MSIIDTTTQERPAGRQIAHRAPSRVETFMARIMTADDRAQIRVCLPQHISFERFERNLMNALMSAPKLLDCNPREVFREVAKIAAVGLLLDPQLGEAYLIASNTGPQARVGYRGLIKLARQSGDVAMIYAHEVYSGDEIECHLGDEKKLTHRPNLFGDRGEIVGYYAVIKYKDGETDFEPMTPAQINAIRDKSDGYKAYKAGKIKDTPWASSYDEMAKKTCIRRLMKRSPQSPDLANALQIEDNADFGRWRELPADDAPGVPASRQSLPERMAALSEGHPEDPPHDPETGEILSDEELAERAKENAQEPDQEDALRRAAADREELETMAREMALSGRRIFDEWYTGLTPEQHQILAPHMKNLMDAANKAGRKA